MQAQQSIRVSDQASLTAERARAFRRARSEVGPATTPAPSWDLFVRDKPSSKERLVFFGGLIINTTATSFVLCSKEAEGLVVGGKGARNSLGRWAAVCRRRGGR